MDDTTKNIIIDLLQTARSEGADAAEATLVRNKGVGVEVRLGKFESVEHAEDFQLGLRSVYWPTVCKHFNRKS